VDPPLDRQRAEPHSFEQRANVKRQKPSPHSLPATGNTERQVTVKLPADGDVALLGGPTSDGKGVSILRARQGRLEAGEVRPLESGKPISGEVVSLKPRQAFPLLCDVETHVAVPQEDLALKESQGDVAKPRSGPAQVASDTYRANWDTIYRRDKKKPELLN
jgi:hypothetical protein